MTIPLGMDFETAGILAAIALAEGVARVPPGATVFRRTLWGPWHVSSPLDLVGGWGLVHRFPPLSQTVLVPGPPSGADPAEDSPPAVSRSAQDRLHAIRIERRAADVLGFISLLVLVLGVPAAVHAAGVFGGALAVVACISCQFGLAGLEWGGLGRLDIARRDRWRLVLRNLNPFSAPAASSRLLAEALRGTGPVVAARALLRADDFARWSRPLLHDARMAGSLHPSLGTDVDLTEAWVVDVLGRKPVLADGDKWCYRCAAVYQAWATECAECKLPLRSESSARFA